MKKLNKIIIIVLGSLFLIEGVSGFLLMPFVLVDYDALENGTIVKEWGPFLRPILFKIIIISSVLLVLSIIVFGYILLKNEFKRKNKNEKS